MCPSRLHFGMPLLGVAQKLFRPRPNNIWACFGAGPQDANQGTPKTYFLALENNIWAGSSFLENADQGTPKTCFWHWKITFGQFLGWFAGQGPKVSKLVFSLRVQTREPRKLVLGAGKEHIAGKGAERVQMSFFLEYRPGTPKT